MNLVVLRMGSRKENQTLSFESIAIELIKFSGIGVFFVLYFIKSVPSYLISPSQEIHTLFLLSIAILNIPDYTVQLIPD